VEVLSDSAGTRELPLLEAFLTEYRPSLRRPERHRSVLSARRTGRLRFDAVTDRRRTRTDPVCALSLARFATLGFVLELFVGKEQLFASRPDEIRRAIHTP
jgi:hypothetical protein